MPEDRQPPQPADQAQPPRPPAPQMGRTARLWLAGGVLVALWLVYLLREIWLPLVAAFLIAMVLDPVVDRMERRGLSRTWASLLIFIGFSASVGTFFYFAAPAAAGQAEQIAGQVEQYIPGPGNSAQAHRSLSRMLDRTKAPPYLRAAVERGTQQFSQAISRSTIWVSENAVQVLSNLIWLVIIPIVTFYALRDFHVIFGKALLLVPNQRREFVQTMVAEVTTIFARYLRGLMLVSFLNGVATWVLLLVLRVPNSFTLGAIAGILYSVPYLGALVTVALVAGMAFLAGGLKLMLVTVIANVLLHQVLFDQLITPRILGGHVGLHPILSIVALLAGNVLLGIPGMVLAVPVAASVQILVLALVPKLAHEIDIAPTANGAGPPGSVPEKTKDEHIERDATEELHRSVSDAVAAIEAKAREADATDEAA